MYSVRPEPAVTANAARARCSWRVRDDPHPEPFRWHYKVVLMSGVVEIDLSLLISMRFIWQASDDPRGVFLGQIRDFYLVGNFMAALIDGFSNVNCRLLRRL